jgi:hypothetical protein
MLSHDTPVGAGGNGGAGGIGGASGDTLPLEYNPWPLIVSNSGMPATAGENAKNGTDGACEFVSIKKNFTTSTLRLKRA